MSRAKPSPSLVERRAESQEPSDDTRTCKPRSLIGKAADIATEELDASEGFIDFYDRLFGPRGRLVDLFQFDEELTAFLESEAFDSLARLANRRPSIVGPKCDNVQLRIPRALFARIASEAKAEGLDLDTLCMAKLAFPLSRSVAQLADPDSLINRLGVPPLDRAAES